MNLYLLHPNINLVSTPLLFTTDVSLACNYNSSGALKALASITAPQLSMEDGASGLTTRSAFQRVEEEFATEEEHAPTHCKKTLYDKCSPNF